MNYKSILLFTVLLLITRLFFCMNISESYKNKEEGFEYFVKLPLEIQKEIVKLLDFKSIKNIRLACKELNCLIEKEKLEEYKKADSLGLKLIECIKKYYYKDAEKIINSGKANLNFKNTKNYGETPLTVASITENTHILELLLDKKVNLDICDNQGNSVLIDASFIFNINNEYMSKLLIETYKARYGEKLVKKFIDWQNRDGFTALMNACKYNVKNIVELLINYGAATDLKNRSGETAFDLSSDEEIKNIIFKKYA